MLLFPLLLTFDEFMSVMLRIVTSFYMTIVCLEKK